MFDRTRNFYAGPSTLPREVLEEISESFVDYQGAGMSIVEMSHRSTRYDEVHSQVLRSIRELLDIPENYEVLLLGGGATLQFAMIPMNLIPAGGYCDFVLSGSWAKKAADDAKLIGRVNTLFDGADTGYTTLPDSIESTDGAEYLHITSNETINGVQWHEFNSEVDAPLVADMSSDIMSRRIPVDRFGLIYAGSQKNLGPAGVTLVIIRRDILDRCKRDLPAYLSYRTHAEKSSLYNTPPVFSIYAVNLVLGWIKKNGGLPAMEQSSREKAAYVYDAISGSEGFYTNAVDPSFRSNMNVVFGLADQELEGSFLSESESRSIVGLKGHRSVGGCRASLYNSLPKEWAKELADFMKEFALKNG